MTTRRGLACFGIAAAVTLLLAGCTTPAPGSWQLSPLTVGDGASGEEGDITFGVWNISDDTAGGVWTESAGSWLGVAADGSITRFTEEARYGPTALDIAALNETMLYVLRPLGSGVLNTTVELFDTATRASEAVLTGQRVRTSPKAALPFTADGPASVESPLGPITSIDVDPDGLLVFVERVDVHEENSGAYVVRRMTRNGDLETLAGAAGSAGPGAPVEAVITQPEDGEQLRGRALAAESIDVSAGDPRGVVVGTEHGVFQITADGTARAIDGALPPVSPHRAALEYGPGYRVRPIDADDGGSIVLPVAEETGAEAPVHITGGSARFREFADGSGAGPLAPGLAVYDTAADPPLGSSLALRRARSAVWVAPGVLVAVIPSPGGESALARIELP
ncbi:hypothetical protein ASC66_16330 [Leifsonia sp. Root4]|uniref:hypothetical protein n=1 Tax=Leifsonia sp. Root4 TaxID=1736525 RepID=UPI0006F47A64|nr:hypothetical protein [Leifsonia sp. Root4]KQW04028.1 hypothetical protein ASC66_16330 [Leifsonia sp. Root4]